LPNRYTGEKVSRTGIHRRAAEPESLQLNDIPSIKGKAAAVAWYREVLGVEVTMNNVVAATNNRELASYMIGRAVHYAPRDLWNYVTRNRRGAEMGA
jgi:hypothetical protein